MTSYNSIRCIKGNIFTCGRVNYRNVFALSALRSGTLRIGGAILRVSSASLSYDKFHTLHKGASIRAVIYLHDLGPSACCANNTFRVFARNMISSEKYDHAASENTCRCIDV